MKHEKNMEKLFINGIRYIILHMAIGYFPESNVPWTDLGNIAIAGRHHHPYSKEETCHVQTIKNSHSDRHVSSR